MSDNDHFFYYPSLRWLLGALVRKLLLMRPCLRFEITGAGRHWRVVNFY